MEFRLLGPVELRAGDRSVDAGPARQRCVLAALAAEAGRLVPVETLVDRVWDQAPPQRVRQALYTYVTRIRRSLRDAGDGEPARLVRGPGGYLLDVAPDRVDLHRFRRLAARARDEAGPRSDRLELLRQALRLWRGTPLAGLPGAWTAQARESWRQEHLAAVLAWAEAEVSAGNGAAVIGPLTELVNQNPLTESVAATLMRALRATGRGADALECHARIRQRLAEELGVDPGPELQSLYLTTLRGTGAYQPSPGSAAPSAPVRPAQLPLDVSGFAGRASELARLDEILAEAGERPTTVVVAALWGTAGVGKTALAVRWAHRVRHRFPDGQLYVDLRGFDPRGIVTPPAEAVRGFLDALAVPTERVPSAVDSQISLYRTLLADRRMLVVLDNARDAAQVLPLLPGTPGCLAIVTSRHQLTGLISAAGARPLTLGLLSAAEAGDLLVHRVGPGRVAAQPEAAADLVGACARLPLALAVVAARAVTRPEFPLAAYADELRDARSRLDALAGPDPTTDVRAVLSWSYRALDPEAARLFRLLGLHPGPDLSTAAAASLAGTGPERVRPTLVALTRAHLLAEPAPGRYSLHDLLRAYAAERADASVSATERRAAVHRMLDHYLHTGHAAALLLRPRRDPVRLTPARPGVTLTELADDAAARSWFRTEHAVLPAVVDHAARAHFDTHTRQLAWTMADHLHRPEPPHDRLVTHPRLAAGRGDLRGRRRPVTASPPRVASTSAAAFDRAG